MALVYARPDADSIDGTWTNETGGTTLFSSIDETALDDADYIISSNNPNPDLCKISLSDPVGTSFSEPLKVRYRCANRGQIPVNLQVSLLQGVTVIAQWDQGGLTSAFATNEQQLTTTQFNAISDFTNLFLQFNATQPTRTVTATGAGTFIVPLGVTSLTVEAWGGGGPGAGNASNKGCGGSGGGYSRATLTVTAGQTVFYTVGAGGIGTNGAGSDGGVSWVNPAANSQPSSNGVVAGGGKSEVPPGDPDTGGVGTIGTTNFTGGPGGDGSDADSSGGSGGGGAGSNGNGTTGNSGLAPLAGGIGGLPDGGNGGASASSGSGGVGVQPGGGGGGTYSGTPPGNGADGQVRFTWS